MTDEHTESRAEFKSGVRALLSIHTEIHMGRLPVSMLEDALQGLWSSHEARIASLTAELDELKARMPVGPYILPNGVVNANLMDDGTDQAPTLRLALELPRRLRADSLRIDLPIIDRDEAQSRVAALEKAARNARDHFYEFIATPDGLAASGFGDAMDWLDVALSTTQPAPLKPQEGV